MVFISVIGIIFSLFNSFSAYKQFELANLQYKISYNSILPKFEIKSNNYDYNKIENKNTNIEISINNSSGYFTSLSIYPIVLLEYGPQDGTERTLIRYRLESFFRSNILSSGNHGPLYVFTTNDTFVEFKTAQAKYFNLSENCNICNLYIRIILNIYYIDINNIPHTTYYELDPTMSIIKIDNDEGFNITFGANYKNSNISIFSSDELKERIRNGKINTPADHQR